MSQYEAPTLHREPEQIALVGEALRLVVYGTPKAGKTTLAMSFPRPLVVDTDDGLISVTYAKGGDVAGERWVPEGAVQLEALAHWLRQRLDRYDTIVIDDIDGLCDLLISELVDEHAKSAPKSGKEAPRRPLLMASVPEQIEYLGNQRQIKNFLQFLRQTKRHVVITSGLRIQGTGEMHVPNVAPSIQSVLGKWASVLGEMVADVRDPSLGDDKAHRVLFTSPGANDVRVAGSRFSEHEPFVVDPTYDALWNPVVQRLLAAQNGGK